VRRFANSWYQKKETRNELLIEALMGRSNKEISRIKSSFRDAKYDASLEKAVAAELPANKFRLAVMSQLTCGRMEEDAPLDPAAIRDDVSRLGSILASGGGETEMVGIIVKRSDRWLCELAVQYRITYERDLGKAIIRHSKNLVVGLLSPPPQIRQKGVRGGEANNHRAKLYCIFSTARWISPCATRSCWIRPSTRW
jgi:hypothetical protein